MLLAFLLAVCLSPFTFYGFRDEGSKLLSCHFGSQTLLTGVPVAFDLTLDIFFSQKILIL